MAQCKAQTVLKGGLDAPNPYGRQQWISTGRSSVIDGKEIFSSMPIPLYP